MAVPADPLDRALLVLSCVAAEPRLSGVLFLDLDPPLLQPLAEWLADHMAALEPATARPPVHVIGSSASDESLWVRTELTMDGLSIVPGILVEQPADPPQVIVVPDLCRASAITARAAVTTIGAGQASAERTSMSYRWQPRARWLAAADRTQARALSAHLLDRFPIRVAAAGIEAPWTQNLTAAAGVPEDGELLRDWLPKLRVPARRSAPTLSRAAAERVVAIVPPGPSRRRDLAVCFTARALAASDGAREVAPAQVDDAATLLGLAPSAASAAPPDDTREPPVLPDHKTPGGPGGDGVSPAAGQGGAAPAASPGPGMAMDLGPVMLDATGQSAEPFGDWPYPEDHPDALAPHESLLDPRSRRSIAPQRVQGRPIGTRHATDLHDIAIVATLLEAAKFQRLRGVAPGSPLVIWPTDLRKYRHQPSPAAALVLVIDHSCWTDWDMGTVIGPYLYRAYRENAAVSVVEFGHRGASPELRAVGYRARSLLDPRVTGSLDRPPGLASPLAHALDLAVQEVRRQLRATPNDRVALLVATDGRGNVPLAASLLNRLPGKPVDRAGIRDALTAASAVKSMSGVEAVVIAPGVDQYGELPFDLAEAMGGKVIVAGRITDHQEPQA